MNIEICVDNEDSDLNSSVIHESVHAADETWQYIKRHKDMKNVNGSEMRAYLVADLYVLYRNCQRYGWKKSPKLFNGMVLSNHDVNYIGMRK